MPFEKLNVIWRLKTKNVEFLETSRNIVDALYLQNAAGLGFKYKQKQEDISKLPTTLQTKELFLQKIGND